MAFTKITAAGIGSTETVTLDGLSVINNESIGGNSSISGNLTVTGNANIGGVLTYEDVTNVDSVGLITARDGIVVGSGITLSVDGDGFFTGVVTATTFKGDGSNLTGIDADKISEGNTEVETIDTGSDGHIKFTTEGSEVARITASGHLGIGVNPADTTGYLLQLDSGAAQTFMTFANSGSGNGATNGLVIGNDTSRAYITQREDQDIHIATNNTDRLVLQNDGHLRPNTDSAVDLGLTNTRFRNVYADTLYGDGSNLTGIEVGLATASAQVSGITTVIDLSKDDIRLDCTGLVTVDAKGGTEGGSHSLRIVNSGIATVTFNSYFKFPSGGAPNLPTASGAISLISFTVHTQGRVGVASVFLAGSSVNFS